MKKIIIISLGLFISAGVLFTGVKKASQELMLANIEALATGETGDISPCWSAFESAPGYKTTSCLDCDNLDNYKPAGFLSHCEKR